MELLGRLRRAVKKLTFLLSLRNYLTTSTWQLASMIRARAPATIKGAHHRLRRRALSFNDRPGLRACVEVVVVNDDDENEVSSSLSYDGDDERLDPRSTGSSISGSNTPSPLRRTTSYPLEQDIDKQAEMFIENFYRHLVYEKQVSLNLRYCQDYNSFNSSTRDSIVSPVESQLVSPT